MKGIQVNIEEIRRLHTVSKPIADETLNGFIGRHAMLNDWQRFGWINEYSGVALPQKRHSDNSLARLSRLFGLPVDALDALQPGRPLNDRRHGLCEYKGRFVPSHYHVMRVRRVCPLCLANSNHHRDIWDFQFVRVCPVHAVRLLDTCPCGKQLDWKTGAFHHCKAADREGVSCVDLRTVVAPAVELGRFSGQTFVLGLIEGSGGPVPPLLEGLNAAMAVAAMHSFGDFALRDDLGGASRWAEFGLEPGLRFLDDRTTEHPEVAMTVGYRILSGSVADFRDMLAVWRHRIGIKALRSLGGPYLMQAQQTGYETCLGGEILRGLRVSKVSPGAN